MAMKMHNKTSHEMSTETLGKWFDEGTIEYQKSVGIWYE